MLLFLSVATLSAVVQCALWIISHMEPPHSEVPTKRIRALWSHEEEVAFLQFLVKHQLDATQGCFKAAALTVAINLISHLHVKGPVDRKSVV